MAHVPATRVTDYGAQTRVICAYPQAAPTLDCAELKRRPSTWAYRVIGPGMIVCASSPLLAAVLRTAIGRFQSGSSRTWLVAGIKVAQIRVFAVIVMGSYISAGGGCETD